MTSQVPNGVQIDRLHSSAICTEIGERLRAALAADPNQLPPHLLGLSEQLDSGASGDIAFKISVESDFR
jgi:hypothetical protein